jgi:lysozyme
MNITKETLDLIKEYEGLKLQPYICSAGKATIGYGNTYYEDGFPVKISDPPITKNQAELLFLTLIDQFKAKITKLIIQDLTDNQFGALLSFAYNVGIGNFRRSTLLKKVNVNPEDPSIADEFLKWNKAGGKILNGLKRRRRAEVNLYFKHILC